MIKSDAIALLGGTVASAALEIGCSYQAVVKWPDELPARIADRVQAALWRRAQRGAELITPAPPAATKAKQAGGGR